MEEWNRVFLLVSAAGLFVDPLFFYALSINKRHMCVFVDGWFAIMVTVLRCMTDALHVWNMWLQLRVAKGGAYSGGQRAADRRRWWSKVMAKRFFFDLFVILPLPQVCILWQSLNFFFKN